MKNKKKNKKTYLYLLLGVAGSAAAVYVADKYIPGFNENITKPVVEFAKKSASNVKNYLLADDTKETKNEVVEEKIMPEKRRKFSYKEINNGDRRRFDNNSRHHHRREKRF